MESVFAIVIGGQIRQLKFFKRNATKDVFLIIFQTFHYSSFSKIPSKMYEVIFIEVFSYSNDFIIDLVSGKLPTIEEHSKGNIFL